MGKGAGEKGAVLPLLRTSPGVPPPFAGWFVVSALVVRIPAIGFKFTERELFWLAAMPGLAGGSFRIIHTLSLIHISEPTRPY